MFWFSPLGYWMLWLESLSQLHVSSAHAQRQAALWPLLAKDADKRLKNWFSSG